METSRGNNISVSYIDLNPQAGTMTVLASASPFVTPTNHYPNGMLIRSETNPAVYVMQNNKKQLFSTAPTTQVYILPQGVFDAIPTLNLIKAASDPTVYVLNENGFRRGIASMEIFNSYGFRFEDITEISISDLSLYPETDMVKKSGDNTVYSLSTKKPIGTMDGLTPSFAARVHTINQTEFQSIMIETVATGLFVPWDIVILPDSDMLFPQRSGTIRRSGKVSGEITVPSVLSTGEGGLMGVVLHPRFTENNLIYVYYTTSENGPKNRIARFRLNGTQLSDQTIILDNIPSAIYHDGGRLAFGPDGMLYATTGDANNPSSAQDLNSLAGKTLRLTPEGQIPTDNPFGTAVWSYGHRNSQGIAWDAQGRMWETEHGRSGSTTGFDELNLIEKGKNYGWPIIQGSETRTGMVTPILNSGANETWAPAGIAFAHGKLYFGGLLGSTLYQVNLNGTPSITKHFNNRFGRIRAVVTGSDGSLYFSTSNRDGRGTPRADDDKILRILPAGLPGL
jgi:glucose/arabinose dehydrogenase